MDNVVGGLDGYVGILPGHIPAVTHRGKAAAGFFEIGSRRVQDGI